MSTSPSISHVARIWTIRKRGHQIRTYTNRPQQLSAKPSHQATVSRLSSRETVRLFLSFVPSRLLVIDFFAFSLFCRALAAAAAAAAAEPGVDKKHRSARTHVSDPVLLLLDPYQE